MGIYRTRGAALRGKFALKRAWKRFLRRRLRRELDSLSDHLLADVGVSCTGATLPGARGFLELTGRRPEYERRSRPCECHRRSDGPGTPA
ncbi:MAG: DUF1127 domain-containing protein [Rhodobacteraceae bacterium]|nr:DUF1127 domain-containing protein [Paracoccaceae bacterium]